jgi:thioredoxin reductase (NADPH)
VVDIVVVGAGPVGISVALSARRAGLSVVILDKGVVANHLLDFPTGMSFFTPRHSLELQGIPLDCGRQHALREEIISYYGRMARLAELTIHDGLEVLRVDGAKGDFVVHARARDQRTVEYRCRNVVLATGVFGKPLRLAPVPGDDLPKVSYLYRDPYQYIGKDVVLVGAGNSSAGAALALYLAGARVTVLDRNDKIPATKWRWHLDDLQQLVRSGAIRLLHNATLTAVRASTVEVSVAGRDVELPNDAVIALLGYAPDSGLLGGLGIETDPRTEMPRFDPCTLETKRPGLYLAGIVCAGRSPDKIFVWGARHHAKTILHHIQHATALPGLADLDINTVEHWAQFEKLSDSLDDELAMRLVPIVTGEIKDDYFDVYEHATGTANLYAPNPERPQMTTSLLLSMEGWLLQRNDDGSVVFKGQKLSEGAFEILQLCDGTRRLSDIVTAIAARYEQDASEIREMVLGPVLSWLRAGKIAWRVDPIAACDV